MLKLSGYNFFSQLGEKSNSTSIDNYPAIISVTNSQFNASIISSFCFYYDHTILITKDGTAFAVGNNDYGQIFGSLPQYNIKKYTSFEFKDCVGRLWYPISAVCGYEYTLYLVSSTKNRNKTRLALSHYKYGKENEPPLFLNIGIENPIALFGGRFNSAAIDDEGSVIFIPESIYKLPTVLIESTSLPNNEKAVNIACCNEFILVAALSGRLFISDIPPTTEQIRMVITNEQFTIVNETNQSRNGMVKLNFKQVESLEKTKIISVSGTWNHCFAVSEEGKVFGFGSNESGKLGLGKEITKVNIFTEIKALNKYKIKMAYAGWSHSLFQTEEGKILACGSNLAGELLNNNISSKCYYLPIETVINEGSTFCFAGKGITGVFISCDPSMSPNRTISEEKLKPSDVNSFLKAENDRLNLLIKKMQDENKKLYKNDHHEKIELFEQKMIDKLKQVNLIYQGSQSEVVKVSYEQEFALKVLHAKTKSKMTSSFVNNECDNIQLLLQEYEILHVLNHRNIIKIFGFCYGDESHSPSILMQFCPHNLLDVVSDMKLIERVCAIFEICLGMEAVHALNLIHRNLKPENILIDEKGHIRLSDFGLSCLLNVSEQASFHTSGALKFMAPEILNENDHYDNKVDIYSFGVIAFFILTGGQLPKISIIDMGIGKKAPIPNSINEISRELINKCWSNSSEERPSFTEIIEFIKSKNLNLIDGAEKSIDQIKSFLSI